MYIHHIRVRNYMIHQDTSLSLRPLTVFVGPNGGGKSAMFDAMLNFSMLSRGNLRQAFGPYPYSFAATRYRGASSVSRMGFEVTMSRTEDDSESLTYLIDYSQRMPSEDQPQFVIFNEKLTRTKSGEVIFDRTDPDRYPITSHVRLEEDRSLFSAIRSRTATGGKIDPPLEYMTQQISRFNKFRLDPFVLAAPNRLPSLDTTEPYLNAPRIGYHGEDLAATLYYLSETGHESIGVIRKKLRELTPEFENFDFNVVGTDRIAFGVRYGDVRETIPSVRLSSGMLIFIGLIVLVSTPNRPPVLMIEEPENGLTPQALKLFYQSVRQLTLEGSDEGGSQVLISSHSPFVICESWNGEDRDFIYQIRVSDGKSIARKFSDVINEHGVHLQKDAKGDRAILSLKNAEEIMSGRFSSLIQ